MVLDAPTWGELRADLDGAVVLADGMVAARGSYEQLSRDPRWRDLPWEEALGRVIIPGLVDLHTHLPQYPGVARGGEGLLPWLRQVVFPLEKDFTGPIVREQAAYFFRELAAHGTTTAMVYSAIYEDATQTAFEEAAESGLRIVMGKMMMDVASYGNLQPKKIPAVSIAETERLCDTWHGAGDGRLAYAVSPRFAVSCSEKLMREAARIAAEKGVFIQTHLAENLEELQKVKALFMACRDYTDVYAQFGLLTPKTVLGHCIHLTQLEMETIAHHGSAVAHCPTSNFYLGSGLMPLDRLRKAGIRVGLGSDVAAGPELNMWTVMRSAIETQKARRHANSTVEIPSPEQVFHMATAAGGAILGLTTSAGLLEADAPADLVLIDACRLLGAPALMHKNILDRMSPADFLALLVYRGGPHAVVETIVHGRSVYAAPSPGLRAMPTAEPATPPVAGDDLNPPATGADAGQGVRKRRAPKESVSDQVSFDF